MLVQRGDVVRVAMTEAAARFVGPATFEAISAHAVYTDPWTAIDDPSSQHVAMARGIDVMLIAPCSMNTLAKLAQGLASDPVTLLAAAVDRQQVPVILAPSMNAAMFSQPATRRNLETLASDGFTILEPDTGWQACRTDGCGRLPDPESLQAAIDAALAARG